MRTASPLASKSPAAGNFQLGLDKRTPERKLRGFLLRGLDEKRKREASPTIPRQRVAPWRKRESDQQCLPLPARVVFGDRRLRAASAPRNQRHDARQDRGRMPRIRGAIGKSRARCPYVAADQRR